MRTTVFLLSALCGLTSAAAQAQCDPTSNEVPARAPREQQLSTTCGNGKLDAYATNCVRRSSGGCGHPYTQALVCEPAQESCDGAELAGQTCQSFEFGGGKLGCRKSCIEFDTSRCTLCARGEGKTCRELVLPGPLRPFASFQVLPVGDTLRAFWVSLVKDVSHLVTAPLKDDLSGLARPAVDLGTAYSDPVARSGGWFFLDRNAREAGVLRKVDLQGRVTTIPTGLPDDAAQLHLLISEKEDRLVVVSGALNGVIHVAVFDGSGARVPFPSAPLYVRNEWHRAVLTPLAAGPVSVQLGKEQLELTAQADDQLIMVINGGVGSAGGSGSFGLVTQLHDGRSSARKTAYELIGGALAVSFAKGPEVRFGKDADVVNDETYPAPLPPSREGHPFGAFARPVEVQTPRGPLFVAEYQLGVEGDRDFKYRVALARE
jgi:hypothetical protein